MLPAEMMAGKTVCLVYLFLAGVWFVPTEERRVKGGCSDPGTPTNGKRVGSSFRTGRTVRFRCNPGFYLVGSAFRTCQPDGEWGGKEPLCREMSDQDTKECASLESSLKEKPAHTLDLDFLHVGGNFVFYFVFDSSDGVRHSNFNTSIKFAKALIQRVGLLEKVQIGIVSFGTYAKIELFPLPNTRDYIMEKLSNVSYIGGAAAGDEALDLVQRMVYTNSYLVNTKSVVFLLIDGTNRNFCKKAAQLKNLGAEIFVISVTDRKEIHAQDEQQSCEGHTFCLQCYETVKVLVDQILTGEVDYSPCGISVHRNSIRHQEDDQNDEMYWPWMAQLKIKNYDRRSEKVVDTLCGGSIVDNYWILTSSHCLQDRHGSNVHPDNVTVTVGVLQADGEKNEEQRMREVDKLWLHPDFNILKLNYDVALLKLKTPVVYSRAVQRICLPPLSEADNLILYRPEEKATVIGFGKTTDQLELSRSKELKEIDVKIQTAETCLKSIENTTAVMTDHMFCAGNKEGGKDACGGFAGGPLMRLVEDSRSAESHWVQIGIVSWGLGNRCGQKGQYTFYTHLAKVKSWVTETMVSE